MYTAEYLESRRVWFERLLHQPASSSAKRARSVHVPGRSVAKTVLVKAGDRILVVVLPSTSRIDWTRLGQLIGVGAHTLSLGTSDDLVEIFRDCEPGVVPPFGRLYNLETVFDASLAEVAELIFGGNTRHEGLRIRSRDYLAIEEPLVGSFAAPGASGRPAANLSRPDRRAG
jgi:Ala-tRNA(Pro) deacylase